MRGTPRYLCSKHQTVVDRMMQDSMARHPEVRVVASAIEWTDATWNLVRGCTKISPGCKRATRRSSGSDSGGESKEHLEIFAKLDSSIPSKSLSVGQAACAAAGAPR